jgi:hypothetical protein
MGGDHYRGTRVMEPISAAGRLAIATRQVQLLGEGAEEWRLRLDEAATEMARGVEAIPRLVELLSAYAEAEGRWTRRSVEEIKAKGIPAARERGGWAVPGLTSELVRILVAALVELGAGALPTLAGYLNDPDVSSEGRGWLRLVVEQIGQGSGGSSGQG